MATDKKEGTFNIALSAQEASYEMPSGDFSTWAFPDDGGEVCRPRALEHLQLVKHWRTRGEYVEDLDQMTPVSDDVLEVSRWRRVLCGGWNRPEAIHMKECRTAVLGLRRATRSTRLWGSVLCSLGDNL